MKIRLYGTERCHKTQYYKTFLQAKGLNPLLDYAFLDVEQNKDFAQELRNLYTTGKLNFPTITIGDKKLRNPSNKELNKWLDKLL